MLELNCSTSEADVNLRADFSQNFQKLSEPMRTALTCARKWNDNPRLPSCTDEGSKLIKLLCIYIFIISP